MTASTSRAEFEKLIDLRMEEAKLLLANGQWDGAYYLAGYAVEFALKVRIIGDLVKSDGFPERKAVESFYRHDLLGLRSAAGLADEMENDAVKAEWDVVKRWNEQSRYQLGKTEAEARRLFDAIGNGVLPWVRARW